MCPSLGLDRGAWPELAHQFEDSDARAQVLRESDAFLHKSLNC